MNRRSLVFLAVTATLAACSQPVKGPGTTSKETPTETDGLGDDDDDDDDDSPVDGDGDGSPSDEDCDDDDPNRTPGAPEICDGIDNDCDGEIPADETDRDGDGRIECEEDCTIATASGTLATAGVCEFAPSPAGTLFAASIEWAMTHRLEDPTSGAVFPAYTFAEFPEYGSVYQAPSVMHATDDDNNGQIDVEDTPDIAVIMATGPTEEREAALRLISGKGTVHDSILWASWGGASYAPYHYAGLAMGDLDGDGRVEIPTTVIKDGETTTCYPAVYEVTQVGNTVSLRFEAVGAEAIACGGHAPSMADLDGDGTLEVAYGRRVYRPNLTLKWDGGSGRAWYGREDYPWPDGYWNSGFHSVAYDLDGDGNRMELVSGSTVYRHDGGIYCELGSGSGASFVSATDGYPSVGDLDGNDIPEIVITGNQFVSVYSSVPDAAGRCQLIDDVPNAPWDDPAVASTLPAHPNCDELKLSFGGPSTIADFDGDGRREVAVAGSCWYSVFQFTNSRLSRYAMAQTKDWSSASTGSTVFDFNGDGASEVVFSDEDAVYVWGVDDTPGLDPWERLQPYLIDEQHKSWTIHEYPLVADLDGDGKAEILVSNSYLPGFEDRYGLYVLGAADDDWVSARKLWNQHAYYITNVDDDGEVGYGAPNFSPYTSADYNSFRTQAPGAFGALAAPNAVGVGDACQVGCGDLSVWVQVGNVGEYISLAPDVVVGLYGVDNRGVMFLLDDTTLGAYVHPGELTAPIVFEVSSSDWSAYDELVAVIDDPSFAPSSDGRAKECDESDNEVRFSLAGYCP